MNTGPQSPIPSSDIAISVKNLSKKYHLYDSPKHRLKEALHPFRKKYHHDFWALSDVSFEVKKGEAFGIIGRNGSGKSTLLQILCGVLQPTTGEFLVNGRVSALLELGAGFNPELTGIENIFLNASIMGYSRSEMDEKIDDILSFADIGEFIDQPVKTYSSGMFVRLAFATATNVDPNILIVDEAMSVGDFFFQQKCLKKLKQFREMGITLLFVSHDMSIVRDLCQTALYLDKGHNIFVGPSQNAISLFFQNGSENIQDSRLAHKIETSQSIHRMMENFKESSCWINDNYNFAKGQMAKILAVSVLDPKDFPTMKARMGDEIRIRVLYQAVTEDPIHISIALKNKFDQIINCSGSYTGGLEPSKLAKGTCAIFELTIKCMVEAGLYTFSVNLGLSTANPNRGYELDSTPWLGPLRIEWDYENNRAPFLGMFGVPVSAKFLYL